MGELARAASAAQDAQLQAQSQGKTFEGLLRAAMPKLEAVMPAAMNPERLYQIALACYKQDSGLGSCDPASILSCLLKCSALGLEPSVVDDRGSCYLIPRKGSATFMLGYRGMLELMRRSGEYRSIQVQAVHQGDFFEYEYGTNQHLTHRPCAAPGKLTHVYLVARLVSGEEYINVLTRSQVDERRKRSQARSSGPWSTDYEEMAKKTVVRASYKYLPSSVELRDAVAADGTTPEMAWAEPVPEPVEPDEVDVDTGEVA